ncbi:MAG: GntR family transcriptional regulator [Chthoniobacterales bacterium]
MTTTAPPLKKQKDAADRSSKAIVNDLFVGLAPILREENSSLPLYRRLADHIREWIDTSQLQPGWMLLSERVISETLKVSRRTVRAALADLIEHRYVSATHGCGNFVLEPPQKRQFRILALERFNKDSFSVSHRHHDMIHEAEAETQSIVHYRYVPTSENLLKILKEPPIGYDGMILYRPPQKWIDALLKNEKSLPFKLPLMVISRNLKNSGYNFVSPDHVSQTMLATKKLLKAGHKRIGYISGFIDQDFMNMAYQGYQNALEEAGLPLRKEDCFFDNDLDPSYLEKVIQAFLKNYKFTAAVVAGSAFSIPFENAIQRASIHIPSELSVVLVTEKAMLNKLALRWTAYLYPDEIVPRGLKEVVALITKSAQSPLQELIPPGEVEGVSCAQLPPKARQSFSQARL